MFLQDNQGAKANSKTSPLRQSPQDSKSPKLKIGRRKQSDQGISPSGGRIKHNAQHVMENVNQLTKASSFIDTDWRHEPKTFHRINPAKKTDKFAGYESKNIKERVPVYEQDDQLVEEYDKCNLKASTSLDIRQQGAPVAGIRGPYNLDRDIQLVPDRWSPTGWKYVPKHPEGKTYFNSPNRVNSMGYEYRQNQAKVDAARQKYSQSPMVRGHPSIGSRNYSIGAPAKSSLGHYGQNVVSRNPLLSEQFKTSYQRFFSPKNKIDMRSWKDQFQNQEFRETQERRINWGGEQHERKDFNKRKDHLAEWTETFFHH